VALFPDRLIVSRVGGAGLRRVKHKEIATFAPAAPGTPPWQPALEALAAKVRTGDLSGADVTLVLSNHFVHYALVPWSELLKSEEDQVAFARQRFVRVHGDGAAGWWIRVSRAIPRQPRPACAISEALVEAVYAVMDPLGERFQSLQPHLMASFNRCRDRLGTHTGWFVVAEPGLLCVSLLQDGHWRSVRTVKLDPEQPLTLTGVLAREQFLVESGAECDLVSVFAPDMPAVATQDAGRWKIENLLPVLLPGMSAHGDALFAITVGD